MLFVALETVAVCFYTLVAYNRESAKSLEAGIKYLIFGALSSSLLLFGIVLLYGVAGNPEAWGANYIGYEGQDPLGFQYLGNLLEANPDHLLTCVREWFLLLQELRLRLVQHHFRFGCQMFITVLQCPLLHFLAVSSKAAGFFVLLNLVNGPFLGMSEFLMPLLGFVATFTIFFGNLAACAQSKY